MEDLDFIPSSKEIIHDSDSCTGIPSAVMNTCNSKIIEIER